jgi:hypothetical protein
VLCGLAIYKIYNIKANFMPRSGNKEGIVLEIQEEGCKKIDKSLILINLIYQFNA